jgi:hypothetical protein
LEVEMKLVKSLLLGSAAGLVAMTGAQAADLPVKAKPVEYVRICSAYGAGFYYIPGTDICLRVGGYAFIEGGYGARAGVPLIYNYNLQAVPQNGLNRNVNYKNWRARGTVILDARANTAAGTLRTYIAGGWDYNNNLAGASPPGNVTAYFERAFTQWAGFTFGFAATFFDFGGYYSIMAWANIAWNWNPVFAYTFQFGNGVSATISVEDGQAHRTALFAGAVAGNIYGGQTAPDIVANVRVDQAWGSAQISAALHQLRVNQAASVAGIGDAWGWAVLGGIEIKLPSLAPGDSIVIQGVYANGAVEYTGLSTSPLASAAFIGIRDSLTSGAVSQVYDGVVAAGATSITKSKAWSANVMFRHFWAPNLRSALWFGYLRYEPGLSGSALFFAAPNMRLVQVGGNVIWSPVPTLDLSLDLLWTGMRTSPQPLVAAGSFVGSTDIWSIWTRWRRNF